MVFRYRSLDISHWTLVKINMYRFEKLRVYQNATDLVEAVYQTVKLLPSDEKFALVDQLKRSSTSIVLNIAEGSVGLGDVEFRRFLKMALRSLYETVAGLKLAEKLFHITINRVLEKCETVGRELTALIKSLNKPMTKDH